MATVTADITLDASGLADVNPFTDPAIVAVGTGVIVGSGAFKSPTGIGGFISSATPTSSTVKSIIEIKNPGSGDPCGPLLLNDAGNGYFLRVNYSDFNVYKVTNYALSASYIDLPQTVSTVALDQCSIEKDESTNTIVTRHNGTVVATFTDADYINLKAGFYSSRENTNGGGAVSWGGVGYAAAGPSISSTTNPTVDGGQSSITTSGLTGTPTATLGGYSITTAGTLPNLTYTLGISSITTTGPVIVPRIGDSLTLSVTGTEGEATRTVATSPETGYAAVTLAGTLATETDGLIDKIQTQTGLTVAVGDIIYYPTANATGISTTGVLTTDSTSINMLLIQGGNATTAGNGYGLTVVPTKVISVKSAVSVRVSASPSIRTSVKNHK